MPRGLWLRVVAPGALLSLVAIGMVAVLTGGTRGGATLKEPALGPTGSAAPASKPALEAVLPGLQRFVEEARGLRFKRPVQLQLLDDDAFRRRIRTLTRGSLVEGNRRLRVLKAFGLVPADADLSQAQRDAGAGIIGLYDPKTNRLVVRGKEPTPYVRGVIVHELTHALQDQHFNLLRVGAQRGGSALGHTGVVEGDATRIEQRYLDSLSAGEQQLVALEAASLGASGAGAPTPPAVSAFVAFPYRFGAQFTTELVERSGQAALDAAFGNPPGTAEQLMHTDAFVAGEAGRRVPAPGTEGGRRALITDTLGEFGIRVLLSDVVAEDEVARAAEGWGGDRYVAWVDGDRNCARLHVVMDTPADAEELLAALRTWAATPANAGTTVEGIDPIAVTSCH
ncbi:MAG: hypothetical protein ACRD0N_07425 [Acidimicrobiales bacterium]